MQPKTAQQLEQEFQNTRRGQPSLVEEGQRLQGEAGIPERRAALESVRKNVLNTQRTLRNVPTATNARARRLSGPVTQAALTRLTSAAQAPLSQQLQRFGEAENVEQQGIAGAQQDVARQLALQQAQRGEVSSDFIRRINAARGRESEERQRAFAREQLQAQQALQAAQLRAQREAEDRQRAFLASLQDRGNVAGEIDPTTGALGRTGIVTGVQDNVVDTLRNTAPGQIATRVGEAGRTIASLGGLLDQNTTDQIARIGRLALDPLDLTGSRRNEAAQSALQTATSTRQGLDQRQEVRVQDFLRANPQFQGRVRTTADIGALQRAGVNLNRF
jgi:hypothetical protein